MSDLITRQGNGIDCVHDVWTTAQPDVVYGRGVIMTTRDRQITLHAVDDGGVLRLGPFRGAAAAWRALDDVDAPPVGG